MNKDYNPKEVEKIAQEVWDENCCTSAKLARSKDKSNILILILHSHFNLLLIRF